MIRRRPRRSARARTTRAITALSWTTPRATPWPGVADAEILPGVGHRRRQDIIEVADEHAEGAEGGERDGGLRRGRRCGGAHQGPASRGIEQSPDWRIGNANSHETNGTPMRKVTSLADEHPLRRSGGVHHHDPLVGGEWTVVEGETRYVVDGPATVVVGLTAFEHDPVPRRQDRLKIGGGNGRRVDGAAQRLGSRPLRSTPAPAWAARRPDRSGTATEPAAGRRTPAR